MIKELSSIQNYHPFQVSFENSVIYFRKLLKLVGKPMCNLCVCVRVFVALSDARTYGNEMCFYFSFISVCTLTRSSVCAQPTNTCECPKERNRSQIQIQIQTQIPVILKSIYKSWQKCNLQCRKKAKVNKQSQLQLRTVRQT